MSSLNWRDHCSLFTLNAQKKHLWTSHQLFHVSDLLNSLNFSLKAGIRANIQKKKKNSALRDVLVGSDSAQKVKQSHTAGSANSATFCNWLINNWQTLMKFAQVVRGEFANSLRSWVQLLVRCSFAPHNDQFFSIQHLNNWDLRLLSSQMLNQTLGCTGQYRVVVCWFIPTFIHGAWWQMAVVMHTEICWVFFPIPIFFTCNNSNPNWGNFFLSKKRQLVIIGNCLPWNTVGIKKERNSKLTQWEANCFLVPEIP